MVVDGEDDAPDLWFIFVEVTGLKGTDLEASSLEAISSDKTGVGLLAAGLDPSWLVLTGRLGLG